MSCADHQVDSHGPIHADNSWYQSSLRDGSVSLQFGVTANKNQSNLAKGGIDNPSFVFDRWQQFASACCKLRVLTGSFTPKFSLALVILATFLRI